MDPRATVLSASFDMAHMVFNQVLADLDGASAGFQIPGGLVPSAAAIAAHSLFGEDMMVSQVAGTPMILESAGFGPRTGLLTVNPAMTPDWLTQTFDIGGLKEYAAAVFARTGEFLNSATAEQLDRKLPSPIGREFPGAEYLASFGVVHLAIHTGDISALKGAQGLKGLPF